jgi:hypothetical protein
MENKYRKILQRAFKVISPDFDPTNWSDQEFQTVFVADVNFLLDHMVRRSKQMQDIKKNHGLTPEILETAQNIMALGKDFQHPIEEITNG